MKKFLFLIAFIYACGQPTKEVEKSKADEVIDSAIINAGGDRYEKATIDFRFRDHRYRSERNGGIFAYNRIKEDTALVVHDIVNNEGFQRLVNEKEVQLADSMAQKYANSVNSVIYFALLPYGLNDEAVIKHYLGEVKIEGQDYHKIKVTFRQEGGGEDYEDTYIYWINNQNYGMDYLAYEFHVEGGGMRFRKAINPRMVNGIKFVDYLNYKPAGNGVPIEKIDSLYTNNGLKLLSEIILEDVEVTLPEE